MHVPYPRLQQVDHDSVQMLDVGINGRPTLSGDNPGPDLNIAGISLQIQSDKMVEERAKKTLGSPHHQSESVLIKS